VITLTDRTDAVMHGTTVRVSLIYGKQEGKEGMRTPMGMWSIHEALCEARITDESVVDDRT
jgi:hypothetical protein